MERGRIRFLEFIFYNILYNIIIFKVFGFKNCKYTKNMNIWVIHRKMNGNCFSGNTYIGLKRQRFLNHLFHI